MKKFAIILAAAATLGVAAPAFAQDVSVRIGTGVHHRHPHAGVVVVPRRHHYRPAIVVRDRSWHRHRHVNRGATIVVR